MARALVQPFLDRVARDFPADFLSLDATERQEYGRDWTKVFAPDASAVAMPRTTDEVSRFLKLCSEFQVPVVPSGGRTGLAGGAMATLGEIVLSLSRMRRMDAVDVLGQTVRVQAGAVTEAVHRHCAEVGLTWPVDFASKGSSQVGGNIATNAGGVKVIRYGLTRQWVLGLQVVLANGDVLELGGALEKNNTGTDLRQLFIGSEGTLGVVTEATLKLARVPGKLDVLLFAVPDLAGVLRLFAEARRGPFTLFAYEFFTDKCLARVEKHRKLAPPFERRATHYVLVEAESTHPEETERWLAELFERGVVEDGVQAQSPAQAHELWALREGISESLSATGLPHKNDVALPIVELEAFCAQLDHVFESRYPGWEICLFGHIGDGNLHVNVMKPDALDKAAFLAKTKEADHDLFTLVRAHQGSISAEHGIGLLKKPYLAYTRSAAEIALLRGVKRALDPMSILNPGKISTGDVMPLEPIVGFVLCGVLALLIRVYLHFHKEASPHPEFEAWIRSEPLVLALRCPPGKVVDVVYRVRFALGKGEFFNPDGGYPWQHYVVRYECRSVGRGAVGLFATHARVGREHDEHPNLRALLATLGRELPDDVDEVWLHGRLRNPGIGVVADREKTSWLGEFDEHGALDVEPMIGHPAWIAPRAA